MDIAQADQFRQTVVGCAEPDVGVVLLDLPGISYMGSRGITTLLQCRQSLDREGTVLRIERYNDAVAHVLTVVGRLDELAGPEDAASVG